MSLTVPRPVPGRHYASVRTADGRTQQVKLPTPPEIVSAALNTRLSTAVAWLSPEHPHGAFARVARITAALVERGFQAESERYLVPIDLARQPLSPESLDELEAIEEAIDGRESEAQLAYLAKKHSGDPTGAWHVRRRRIIDNIVVLQRQLRAGDAKHGTGVV